MKTMKKAFTLVEMLIVVGIIGVLVTVLTMALSGTTESANATKCLANMAGLARACHTYAMDEGRSGEYAYLPFAGSFEQMNGFKSTSGTRQRMGWVGWKNARASKSEYVSPYTANVIERTTSLTNGAIWKAMNRNMDGYVCPQHRKVMKKKMPGLEAGPIWSYAMNARLGWWSKDQDKPMGYRYKGVAHPIARSDRVLLFAELPFEEITGVQTPSYDTAANYANDPILQYDDCAGSSKVGAAECIGFNHKRGKHGYVAHVCFADGHTETIELFKGVSRSNIEDLTRWLCNPVDDNGKQIDVTYSNGKYEALRQ